MDLLDMAPKAAAPLDLFTTGGPDASTPMLPVSPSKDSGPQSQDWNAFQSPAAPQPQQPTFNAFGGGAQPQMQQGQGMMGGFTGQQAPGWGGMGQAPMGMSAGGQGFPMGQSMGAPQSGYGAAFAPQPGMGGMAGGGMPGMGQGGMNQGAMMPGMAQGNMMQGMAQGGMMPGMMQGMAQGGMMPGMPQGGMAPGMAGMQGGAAGRGSTMPGGGAAANSRPAGSASGPDGGVDDLLSQAMDGVAMMSFDQRKGAAGSTTQSSVPMNQMQRPPW